MEKIHELDIYQNAIDSLNVGIEMCERAQNDESKYKFSIIFISNFMELLLKKMVEMQNPLLIFEKPYSERIGKEKTITWLQALQILTNSGKIIKEELIENLRKLTNVRNEIIHYKFKYNVYEIDSIILSVIDSLRQLYKDISRIDIINDVEENTKLILKKIEDDYLNQLHQAQFNAKDESEGNNMAVVDCNFCGESCTAVERINNEVYCYFCEETDREEYCTRCTVPCLISEMEYYGKNEYGDSMYFCQYCDGILNED